MQKHNAMLATFVFGMKNEFKPILLVVQKSRILLIIVIFLLSILVLQSRDYFSLFSLQSGGAATTATKEKFQISDFSPDGKKLYLDYCDALNNCQIGWLDLLSKKIGLFALKNTKDVATSPSSSTDGKQLVIVIKEAANNYETSQIGLLDLEKNTFRAVTHSSTFKEWPSLSSDGKKIIYAQASRIRSSGKTRFSEWDVYETELATGMERRLTDFCFFLVSPPKYMADNKRFVFSGEEPVCNFPVPNTARSHEDYSYEDYKNSENGRALYKKMYQRNTNFMMTGNETTLKPFVISGEQSGSATLSRDGTKIFFTSITNKMDNSEEFSYNYDLFVFEDGTTHRLTNLKTMITGFAVSSRGEQVAYQSDKQRNHNDVLWIMDVTTRMHSKIDLPERSSFAVINVANKLKGESK